MQNKSRMEVVPDMYVRDVPYRIIRRLCQLLDPPGPRNWEVLASMMPEYRTTEIELFRMSLMRPGGSATYEVLNDWGSRNNRVRDLVRLLVAMEHAEAANLVLKDSMPAVCDVHVPNQYQRQRRVVPHLEIRANGSSTTRKDPVPPTPPPSAFSPLRSHPSAPLLSSPPPETVTTVCEVETETKIEEEDQSDFNSLLSSGSDVGGGESIEEKRRKIAQAAINRLEREKLRDELASLTIGDSAATTPMKEKANAMMTLCSDSDSLQSFASSVSPLSPPGSLVECPYRDVRQETDNFDSKQYKDGGHLLGSGGFGTVYHATMWVGGELQSVAVKQLKLQLIGQEAETKDAEMRTLFRNEIQVFAKLGNGHPNLVKLLGYCVDGPEFCLIYEYVRGGSLLDRLACKGNYEPLTWTERVRVSVGSGRGLVYLHKSKHIHRDVKSANILLDSSGNAKLADFGVSKALDVTTSTSVSKGKTYTQKTETIQGTRAYMAQEVFRGSLSVKVDAFAFGIVIYELITGLPPCVPKADSEEMDDLKSLVEEEEDDVEKIIDQKANWPEAVVKDLLKIADDLTEAKRKDRKEVQQILPLLEQLEHRDT